MIVAYIVIGIIVVVGIGLYVYAELSAMYAQQAQDAMSSQVQSLGEPVVLSAAQSAAKAAVVETVINQKPVTLTQKQSAAKAAVIQAFEMQSGGK